MERGLAIVTDDGTIYANPNCKADVEEWKHVLAHFLLHLGFEHFQTKGNPNLWNIACDLVVAKFLHDFQLGRINDGYILSQLPASMEEKLYKHFLNFGVEERFTRFHLKANQSTNGIESFVWKVGGYQSLA